MWEGTIPVPGHIAVPVHIAAARSPFGKPTTHQVLPIVAVAICGSWFTIGPLCLHP